MRRPYPTRPLAASPGPPGPAGDAGGPEPGTVDRSTVDVYEDCGDRWAATRRPVRRADAGAFAAAVAPERVRVDLGCGAGRYSLDIGPRAVGLDAARAMLEQCRRAAPGIALVQGDLEALPFGRRSLGGAWANMSYHHLPSARLPMALADLHGALAPGAPLSLQVLEGTYEGDALADDDIGGRYFAAWTRGRLIDVLVGAGFEDIVVSRDGDVVRADAIRARSLADTVGPGMRLLVVGLNPSLYAADQGVAFGRPGNRFWPAALGAGLLGRDRDPVDALTSHGVGITDLVKRASVGAGEIDRAEYRAGMARIDRLARWLAPAALCMVGLAGWRAAVDPTAVAGLQDERVGGRPTYVMPSTSGVNAHASLDDLVGHFAAAGACAARAGRVHEGDRPLH